MTLNTPIATPGDSGETPAVAGDTLSRMTALLLLLAVPPIMWIGQTLLLRAAGFPARRRIGAHDLPEHLRVANRMVTQGAIVAALVVYPLLRGESPAAYYLRLLPPGRPVWAAWHGLAVALLFLAMIHLAWNIAGCVQFSVRQRRARIVRRLITTPFSALLGAGVEELLFRGVLLAGLLESFPRPAAVAVGAGCFAGAHYVREVKRYWTLPGHLMLGLCLCLAFVWTGSLWLPIGIHAGGILAILAARPFVRYAGPAWVTGASIFPFAGVVGIAALAILTASLRPWYGVGG